MGGRTKKKHISNGGNRARDKNVSLSKKEARDGEGHGKKQLDSEKVTEALETTINIHFSNSYAKENEQDTEKQQHESGKDDYLMRGNPLNHGRFFRKKMSPYKESAK